MRVEKVRDAKLAAALPVQRVDIAEAGEAVTRGKHLQEVGDAVERSDDPVLERLEKLSPAKVKAPFADKGVGETFGRERPAFERIKFRQPPPMRAEEFEVMGAMRHRMKGFHALKIDDDSAKIEEEDGWRGDDRLRRGQNASAGRAITGSAPLFSFARCALASGNIRARKNFPVVILLAKNSSLSPSR